MNFHEYQAKHLLAEYGIPVPDGRYVSRMDEVTDAQAAVAGPVRVVKAQAHTGGRGKAGGVKLVEGESALHEAVESLLGGRLVTVQTGAGGLPVSGVWVEPATSIARELYVSMLVDRARERVIVMASSAGGMDIEEVAATTPEKIITRAISPVVGLQAYQGREIAFALGLEGAQIGQMVKILTGLYRLFMERDASLIEINPLVVTTEGGLLALDGKFALDDNAGYRQPALLEWRDTTQEDARELAASAHGLNYVSLDGDIACMVNGAGLAMATMDLIKLEGGEPANFLDVGGGTTAAKVAEAFKLILSDGKVKAILVNIFGGIVRCDLIAQGIIAAAREVNLSVPTVVRLEGTNAEAGRTLLADSGLALIPENDLTLAARAAVRASRGETA